MSKLEDLTRRAVACKRWRWITGQPVYDRYRVYGIVLAPIDDDAIFVGSRAGSSWVPVNYVLPLIDTPAGLGCLLALVRAAWNNPGLVCRHDRDGVRDWWVVSDAQCYWHGRGETEVEALVVALEAAPTDGE